MIDDSTSPGSNYASEDESSNDPGPFLARVVGHFEPSYQGTLEVELLRQSGNSFVKPQMARMITPFGGVTSDRYVDESSDTYDGTQKSYGMWFVPPDVGTIVMVIRAQGDAKDLFWFGCVPSEENPMMNFMTPGLAATSFAVDGIKSRVPVGEYNKKINNQVSDPSQVSKPQHPLAKVLDAQGLLEDDIRGITTSSARRELPSSVFGISTPGPIDKNGRTGDIIKGGSEPVKNVPVSRLGGTTFVMDDGDDKFLRKSPASFGPPEYASVANKEVGGDPTIPHNELVRIRTRTGHQILLHNSEDLIYIGNAKGTTWIELTSNGKVDIYAKDSVSIHTEKDFNFLAGRDVNIEATRNVNIKAGGKYHSESGSDTEIISGANTKITSSGTSHINSSKQHLETAGKIYMNSPKNVAITAKTLSTFNLPLQDGSGTAITVQSIMKRAPSFEPYAHHENLDPSKVSQDKTDRENSGDIQIAQWPAKPYTTSTDPFKTIAPTDDTQPQGNV